MAFRHAHKTIREAYEERFSANDARQDSLSYGREDLRHHLNQRKNVRPGPYFRNRGREFGPHRREDRDDYKISTPIVIKRDRSPGRREVQPTGHSGSNSSSRSFSPDRDKGYSYQQSLQRQKSNVLTSHGSSSSAEGSAEPHSSGSSEDKTSASVAELEEVAATSMEPKPVPEVDFNARRLEAIKAKALDIEKHYRQDCETFRTVVKMLVAKEPSLENLLQAPLDENLSELKHHCLDALRHFVKELDEVLEQPDTSVKGTHHKTLE
uniref:periphilin-1 isoform X2 n=1 Tax=Monopterus albus TaxID=43700 RepID=UPI0009B44F6F|nr:periphilin-1-like isoform X2 [Monopterus albus]